MGVQLPRIIAGYEFVQLLGVGGFGAVYRAVLRGSLGFEQDVAIKVLDADRARLSPDLVRSLALEAKILSRVQHPNVVQARHFLRVSDEMLGDTWILVMELVRGQTLRRLLTTEAEAPRPLPINAPLQIMSEISDGLHFAHRLSDESGAAVGLVHRDLKPENVMVSNEGRVKILDFGIAYAKKRAGATESSNVIIGTPHYMSPEQLAGERVDRRSDLYALGTIGFEMFAGESFVPRRTLAIEAVEAARETRFERREELLRESLRQRYADHVGEELQEEIVGLLRDLLQQDRTRRPALAGEVFDRIEAISAHRPSIGRTYVRVSVEALNQVDRDSPAPEADATPPVAPTQPLARAVAAPRVAPEDQPTLSPRSDEQPPQLTEKLSTPGVSTNRWKLAALVLAALLVAVVVGQALG